MVPSREQAAIERDRHTRPEPMLDEVTDALCKLRGEGRDPAADPAFGLLVRRLARFSPAKADENLEQACRLTLQARRNQPAIIALLEQPIGYDAARKAAFRAEATRLLRQLADAMGLKKGEFDVDWNEGGIAVSGEAMLRTDAVFVQVSQSCVAPVMFRRVTSRTDYRGAGPNCWADARTIADPVSLANRISVELDLPPRDRQRLL